MAPAQLTQQLSQHKVSAARGAREDGLLVELFRQGTVTSTSTHLARREVAPTPLTLKL